MVFGGFGRGGSRWIPTWWIPTGFRKLDSGGFRSGHRGIHPAAALKALFYWPKRRAVGSGGFPLASPVKMPDAGNLLRCAPPNTDSAGEEPWQGVGLKGLTKRAPETVCFSRARLRCLAYESTGAPMSNCFVADLFAARQVRPWLLFRHGIRHVDAPQQAALAQPFAHPVQRQPPLRVVSPRRGDLVGMW